MNFLDDLRTFSRLQSIHCWWISCFKSFLPYQKFFTPQKSFLPPSPSLLQRCTQVITWLSVALWIRERMDSSNDGGSGVKNFWGGKKLLEHEIHLPCLNRWSVISRRSANRRESSFDYRFLLFRPRTSFWERFWRKMRVISIWVELGGKIEQPRRHIWHRGSSYTPLGRISTLWRHLKWVSDCIVHCFVRPADSTLWNATELKVESICNDLSNTSGIQNSVRDDQKAITDGTTR